MVKLPYGEIDLPKALDYAKRNSECKEDTDCGYEIEGKSTYWNYMSKDSWSSFLNKMSELHQAQYNDGDGGELKEKKGRYGLNPPKMASFGSSSRFIYLQSKCIPNFVFEKQLPTRVGHVANLDGFLCKEQKLYYVEAKCREIYSSHKNEKVSTIYEDVYNELKRVSTFDFDSKPIKDDIRHKLYTFSYNKKELNHFDIKQLICHFLGIAADILENRRNDAKIHFIYLIFNPESNDVEFSEEINKYKNKINDGYKHTLEEINSFGDMKWLFDSVMTYQVEHLCLSPVKYSFDFKLADQNSYMSMLK